MKILKNLFSKSDKENEKVKKAEMDAHHHERKDADHENKLYYCPMKCEGDKVYKEPGRCPVCNMKLVPVAK